MPFEIKEEEETLNNVIEDSYTAYNIVNKVALYNVLHISI